jgi:glutathione S-transferase
MINQAGACMVYLGDQLGYAPTSSAERARATSLLMNSMDYIAEGRRTFHPLDDKKSYKDQKEEGDKVSKEFSKGRMKTFLYHFEKAVGIKGAKSPVAGGSNITFADFALFHALDATVSQFNTEYYDHAWDSLDIPNLKEYYNWMKSRPNLQAYFKSDRCARKYSICFATMH